MKPRGSWTRRCAGAAAGSAPSVTPPPKRPPRSWTGCGCSPSPPAAAAWRVRSPSRSKSLVTQPITTTHHGGEPGERAKRGIADSMIRLPVGLEDAHDLIADLTQALDASRPSAPGPAVRPLFAATAGPARPALAASSKETP